MFNPVIRLYHPKSFIHTTYDLERDRISRKRNRIDLDSEFRDVEHKCIIYNENIGKLKMAIVRC